MKKYALTLMLLAGGLTTLLSYKYTNSNSYKKSHLESQVNNSSSIPSHIVNQENEYGSDNNYEENKKIEEAKKRIQLKYESLPQKEENKLAESKTQNFTNGKKQTFSLRYEVIEQVEDALKVSTLFENKRYLADNKTNTLKNSENSLNNKKKITDLQLIDNKILKEIYPDHYVVKQEFLINNYKENYIIGRNGSLVIFPPNVFLNSKGMIENENILIQLQEYYSKTEILLSGYYTQNQNDIFETEGMVIIKAYKNGEELLVNPAKKIFICLNSDNEDSNYYLFNQNINNEWQQIAEQDKNLIPLPLEILNLHNVFGNTYDKSIVATKAFARRYEFYSSYASNHKKAITGIYLNLLKEPLYKADENVLLYLKDIKADKNIIHQFEKFYEEKLGQVVNFANVYYSSEISLTEQFEQLGYSKNDSERLAQYFLIRKATQEWYRNHPNDREFANKIYKISKLGTFASMKFYKTVDTFTSVEWNNFNGINLNKSSVFFINGVNQSISKVGLDANNKLYIPADFKKGNMMILSKIENDNYVAVYEIINENNTQINLKQNIEFQKFNTNELENRLNSILR